MLLPETMRDVCVGMRKRARNVFYPERAKRDIAKKEDDLFRRIQEGELARNLLNNPGWKSFFLPFLEKMKQGAEDDLRTHKLRHPSGKDEQNFYPTGIIDAMITVLSYPQEKIQQAETARQELGLLQKAKEQDNVT
jgi:hypothetical protein